MTRQPWRQVNKTKPCPACDSDHWCAWSGDLLKCERITEPPHGMERVKLSGSGALFRPARPSGNGRANWKPRPTTAPTQWAKDAERCAAALSADGLGRLAAELNATAEALQSLGVGYANAADLERWRAGFAGDGPKPEGAWTFPERDGGGRIVGLSLRAPDGRKGFPKGAKRGLIIPANVHAKPDPVLVVEGASDEVACEVLGLTAVGRPSNSGGADDVAKMLDGRGLLVVGENDAKETGEWPGRDGAKNVARQLASIRGDAVTWALPPGEAKDIRAWLRARIDGGLDLADAEACKAAGAELLAALQAAVRKVKPEQKPPQSELLVRLALEIYRLGVSAEGEAFAVPHNGPNVAMMFRGSRDALRAQLAREYRRRFGSTPKAAALADALNVLAGEAQDRDAEAVHLRVAEHDGGIIIDLGGADGAAVTVHPGGWDISDISPVLFRRTALTGVLPRPEAGGDVAELRELLNVTEETWPLVLGWLLAAYMPEIPHPILMLGGEQGTGKSTAARILLRCFDASPALLRTAPRDPEQWCVVASASWGVCLDNVSGIKPWLSDTLCKGVTGDGFPKRTLYTDSDVSVLAFRRVLCLTSIDAGALRGDLGERIILADLERIDETNRRTEGELEAAFNAQRAGIFGALLDSLAAVLAALPSVATPKLPRMADFGRVLAAMDSALGSDALPRYVAQGRRVASDVVEADPVGAVLVAMVHEQGELTGTAGELLAATRPKNPDPDWPKNAHGMAARLRRLAGALRAAGIETSTPDRNARPRVYELRPNVGNVGTSESGPGDPENADAAPTFEAAAPAECRANVGDGNPPRGPENADSRHSDIPDIPARPIYPASDDGCPDGETPPVDLADEPEPEGVWI